ncbi:hypothetical protein Tco_0367864 [Tanacetum coccineum]
MVLRDFCGDFTDCVTLFVHWIEDYPLLDGLKIPSHVGSDDGKGDPDNYLHLFECVIRMQKWAMPVACHMFTCNLKDFAWIWWNGQKADSIVNYEDLKAKFRSHFSQQKKFTKMHLAVHISNRGMGKVPEPLLLDTRTIPYKSWKCMKSNAFLIEAKEVATNRAPNDHREGYDKFNKGSSWDNSSNNSYDPVIIKVRISGRQVNRAYMDSGSSCEVIYEHCFLKLKPSIKALRVDSKTPLVGFSEEHSWPLGKVPLEVMDCYAENGHRSLYNPCIKFHTPCGIGTVFSTYEPNKVKDIQKKLKETPLEATKDVLSCVDAEEMVVVNDKYLEQTIIIGKQLSASLKKKLQDL